MDTGLRSLLAELYEHGRRHDATATIRAERRLNITPETGEFLRLLVVDNAVSHAEEMAPFVQAVEQTPGFSTVLAPIGNGEFLILRNEP